MTKEAGGEAHQALTALDSLIRPYLGMHTTSKSSWLVIETIGPSHDTIQFVIGKLSGVNQATIANE